jgi:Flp pilus assembly protein TadD
VSRLALGFALALALPFAGASGCATTTLEQTPDGTERIRTEAEPYSFYRSVSYTLLRTHQYMKASQSIHEMIKRKPSSAEAHTLLARAHVGMKQFELARRQLERALELDEEYPEAHSELGLLMNMMGNHSRADRHHRRAIELQPDVAAYHNNLAFSLQLQGRYREAITSYTRALDLDASARRVHNNLGFSYGELGEMELAYRHFKLAGPPAQASNNMGYVYEQDGDLDRAYDYYLASVTEDPDLIQARRNLERVCVSLGRPVPEVKSEPVPEPEALDPVPPPPATAAKAAPPEPAEKERDQ